MSLTPGGGGITLSTGNQYGAQQISNATIPREGSKMVPFVLDFPTENSYLIDLTLTQQQQRISVVQSVWLDLSKCDADVTLTLDNSNFTIEARAGTQGFYVVLATNIPKFTVNSISTGPCVVIFLNVPVAAEVWNTSASGIGSVTQGTIPWIVAGDVATGSPVQGNPVLMGGRGQNTDPLPVADGQAVPLALSLTGKTIVMPYADPARYVRGSANAATATVIQMIAAPPGTSALRITSVQVKNTGTTTSLITLNDSAATVLIAAAGGGDNSTFVVPLSLAAATGFQATIASASATIYVNAQGYISG